MRFQTFALLVLLTFACVGRPVAELPVTARPEAPEVEAVAGAPAEGEAAALVVATPDAGVPLGVELVDGRVLAWQGTGAWFRTDAEGWQPLPWGGGREEAPPVALRFAVPRAGGGAWVVADNGLYQVSGGALVRSPLSDGVATGGLTWMDALGAGAAEELWLAGSGGVQFVAGGTARQVSLSFPALGAVPPPGAVVAEAPGEALWVAGGRAYLVDVGGGRASWLAEGLGDVRAAARDPDGNAWVATSRGLYLHLRAQGRLVRYTLAPAGSAAEDVRDVSVSGGRVFACAGGRVVRREGEGFVAFGPGCLGARGVRVDASGRTWVVQVEALVQLQTAPPVSFSAEVQPLLAARCQGCHAEGSGGSPVLALTDYVTAKSLSARISARVAAADSPMPPVSAGALSAAEVGSVVRWVTDGMAP